MTNRVKIMVAVIVIIFVILLVIVDSKPYPEITPLETARLEVLRRQAYNDAIKCSDTKQPKLKYEDIEWIVVPESRLQIQAIDGRVELGGYFSPSDSIIYVPYPNRDKRWILIHESLHAIGYLGHPDEPFRHPCRVMVDQNP
jgi:hypothetical protein